jgi:hypothetical protein
MLEAILIGGLLGLIGFKNAIKAILFGVVVYVSIIALTIGALS